MSTERVPALLDGVRVDRALALLHGISRTAAADWVAAGRVRVDGEVVAARSQALRAGSLLAVDRPGPEPPLAPDPGVAVTVVLADEAVVVVDKPPGLVVHPGAGRAGGTLVAGLLARYPDLAELSAAGVCAPERPGVVHRLDQGTSGLLVVARTPEAYRSLVAQFGARTVGRRYRAVVAGHLADDRGLVDAPVGRSARQPTRMAVSAQGRPARTRYRVRRRLGDDEPLSELEAELETGRTHQIRVHLGAIGHPVVGDERYAPTAGPARAALATRSRVARGLAPGRLFLHAETLAFDHPVTGRRVALASALPDDLRRALGES